ncbi:MAG: ABC transporter permease [Halodesulfovibrio sp.]
MLDDITFIAKIAMKSSVAVCFAALGEIYAERSGVLNLGVEGMMLMGALAGVAAGSATGNPVLATLGGMAVGGLLALLHAFFAITLRVNQTLSGLALTILGAGLSSFLGRAYIGKAALRMKVYVVPYLSDIPVIGNVFFKQTPLVYLAYILVPLGAWLLFRTRLGLKIRAVGEDAASADAVGVNVAAIRYGCTVFGGCMAGLGGAYLSLAYTPGWKENMTMGQGWIAIAMVIFATWYPFRAFLGALLFGGLTALQFFFQATGVELIPVNVLRMFPYLVTILVLIVVMRLDRTQGRGAAPAALGVPFSREG